MVICQSCETRSWTILRLQPEICLQGQRKSMKSFPAENRTTDISNMKQISANHYMAMFSKVYRKQIVKIWYREIKLIQKRGLRWFTVSFRVSIPGWVTSVDCHWKYQNLRNSQLIPLGNWWFCPSWRYSLCCGTRRFITVYTKARHRVQSWTPWI